MSLTFHPNEMAAVIGQAHRTHFYRNRIPSEVPTLKEWNKLPFTSKSCLRQNYPFGLLAVPRSELATYHESSGTSGDPTPSFYTHEDWEDVTSRFLRSAVNLSKHDTVLVKTPYSLVMTAHQMHLAATRAGALIVPADNRSTNITPKKVLRLLRDLPVSVAWAMPTETLFWAKASRLQTGEIHFPALRALWVAGEPLGSAKRARLEKIWNTQVVVDYGSTETGSLAGQCSRGNLHAWTDRVYFELIDERSGLPTSTGRGRIVVTPRYRKAMPLIRYDLEDCGEWGEPCACGSSLPVLRILGRSATSVTVDGKTFFPSELESLVYSMPEEMGVLFWRGRYDRDSLEIEIESNAGDDAHAAAWLGEQIHRKLGIPARVSTAELVSKDFLQTEVPFLKPRYLFSKDEDWNRALFY